MIWWEKAKFWGIFIMVYWFLTWLILWCLGVAGDIKFMADVFLGHRPLGGGVGFLRVIVGGIVGWVFLGSEMG
jgi:hypothetical protein